MGASDDPRIRSGLLPPGAASAKQPNDLPSTSTPLLPFHPQHRDRSPACPCAARANVGRTVRSSSTPGARVAEASQDQSVHCHPRPLCHRVLPQEEALQFEGFGFVLAFFHPPVKQRVPCTKFSALGGIHTQNGDPATLPSSISPTAEWRHVPSAAEVGCRWQPFCGAFPSHP